MSKFTFLFVCVVAMAFSSAYAVTDEEKAAFLADISPLIAKCSQSHGVSAEAVKTATDTISADGINPCFIACVLKDMGVLNAQGEFDVKAAKAKLYKYATNDSERVKFEEVGEECASVNDQAVNDGEAGCDRASLLVNCFLSKKAELPL